MDNEIATQIETIELALVKDTVLDFDPAVLSVLDNVESGQSEIKNLKFRPGPDVFAYLFNIANSAYHGSLKVGTVQHFFDVVNRPGMQYTKVQSCRMPCIIWPGAVMALKSALPKVSALPSWEE